jgi:hypothetical protein
MIAAPVFYIKSNQQTATSLSAVQPAVFKCRMHERAS